MIFVDVCQLIPHERIDVLDEADPEHLDFIAFSGHKMYAPFGIGVLIGPRRFFDSVVPYQLGGGNLSYITPDLKMVRSFRERDNDAGTPNAIGVLALEESIRQMEQIGFSRISFYERNLTRIAVQGLCSIPNAIVYLREPHGTVIPFDIEGVPSRLTAEVLAQEFGIGTRAGSFCTYELIRKLKYITPYEEAKIKRDLEEGITASVPSVVRASFSIYNSPEDAARFVCSVRKIAEKGFEFYKSRYATNPINGDWHPT